MVARALIAIGLLITAMACTAPPNPVRVLQAVEIGLATTSHDIIGRDGGSSVLAWGTSIWAFGDTVMDQADATGTNWHFNSFAFMGAPGSPLLTPFSEITEADGALEYFVPPTPVEAAFNLVHDSNNCTDDPCGVRWAIWPGSMVFDAQDQRVLIAYGLIAPPNETGGGSYAVWSDPGQLPERIGVTDSAPHGVTLFSGNDAEYTDGAVGVGDQLYAFANVQDGFGYNAYLGRVPMTQALDRSAWSFWNGSAWTASASKAKVIFSSGLGFNTFYDPYLQLWLVVYAPPFSNDILMRSAPDLTGPWSGETRIFVANRKGGDPGTYDAYAHIELSPDGGRTVYFTFSRPNGNGPFGSEFPIVQVVFSRG